MFRLTANPIACFYEGGSRLAAFRGCPAVARHPEEWLASTVVRLNGSRETLSSLSNGRLLHDEIAEQPTYWLGSAASSQTATERPPLVKLLDVGARLPVHVHPDQGFAGRHLGARHGKSEAWIVLDAAEGAGVYLGLREEIEAAELLQCFEAERAPQMIKRLNRLVVHRGTTIFVPAGQLHSIDPGVFILELQEPTDFSLFIDRGGTGLSQAEALIGLDPRVALACVEQGALALDSLSSLRGEFDLGARWDQAVPLLPPAARGYFRADLVAPRTEVHIDRDFAVAVAFAGAGEVETEQGNLSVTVGDAIVIPWAAGDVRVRGGVQLIWCRPCGTHEEG